MLTPRTLRFFPLALIAVFLSSCVMSTNPLSSPDTSAPDPKLYGTWVNEGGTEIIVIGRAKKSDNEKDMPAGIMRYVKNNISNDNVVDLPGGGLFFVSSLGKENYLNFIGLGFDRDWNKRQKDRYMFMKYEVAFDKLTIWDGNDAAAVRVVQAGTLRGVVSPAQGLSPASATFTDTTANLAQYIQNGGGAVLFPGTGTTKYFRLTTKR